jgi:putative membrane protein
MSFTTASFPERVPFRKNKLLIACLSVFGIFWLSTLIGTSNLSNWFMENALVVIFLLGLTLTYKKFQFSDLSYVFITVYLCLHVYGAKYTYALNPFGFWLQETFQLTRNHYDRIVHFSFGFMLAYPMRDYFKNHFQWPNWVCWVLPCEITLSFSGMYELVEWSVADLFFPEQGDAYLGSQGDIWDAQKDMGLAFIGSILIMLIASSLRRMTKKA